MKRILCLLAFLMSTALCSHAQPAALTINNTRTCDAWVKMAGTLTPGAACGDHIYNLIIPAGASVPFAHVNDVASSIYLTSGSSSPISPPAALPLFRWNYAEIQNQWCDAGGCGLGVGGMLPCVNPVTGLPMYPGPTVCETICGQCASWMAGANPDDVVLTLW